MIRNNTSAASKVAWTVRLQRQDGGLREVIRSGMKTTVDIKVAAVLDPSS
jgi:hypothetical protein